MKTCTSISGGKSSAYVAINYPTDFNVFALVTCLDKSCTPKDKGIVKLVSERIGQDFIATLEDDVILHTILDLEQTLGKKIDWVVGKPFDNLRKNGVPNIMWRYCTELMKIKPMFKWWKANFDEPIEMNIGFRAGEEYRAKRMIESCNEDGLRSYGKVPWQKPRFPMIEDGIHRDRVVGFFEDKGIRFADQNNCVGCFHRNPLVLRKMFDLHPEKMDWFLNQEVMKNQRFKSEMSYADIKKSKPQIEIDFEEWGCDSGYCGL